MTTSPNSSAEAWTNQGGYWKRAWKGGTVRAWNDGLCTAVNAGGATVFVRLARDRTALAAMEAADLAIAELERKG